MDPNGTIVLHTSSSITKTSDDEDLAAQEPLGVYLHIPFCRKACHYCNFHFSTRLSFLEDLLEAMIREITLVGSMLGSPRVDTVYLGGGTPSLLSCHQLKTLLDTVRMRFSVAPETEITVECNPEDLGDEKWGGMLGSGINRFSIGAQSFCDKTLQYLNRSHRAKDTMTAVEQGRMRGKVNINIDLMFALPAQAHQPWREDLSTLVGLYPDHVSVYGLTLEPRTVLFHRKNKGTLLPVTDDSYAFQYRAIVKTLAKAKYEQYEVSSFCLPGKKSRHNEKYWKQKPCVGIGPGACSYLRGERYSNVASNPRYIRSLRKNILPRTAERLTPLQKINEYILARTRTFLGVDTEFIQRALGGDYLYRKEEAIGGLLEKGFLCESGPGHYTTTSRGMLFADEIAIRLMP